MISFTSSQRYYLHVGHTDMRKSFDGLCGLVSTGMNQNIFSGDVFIFINRPRNRMKLLVWDRSGFVIYYKRLEEGTFELPATQNAVAGIEIRWEELVLILEGISLESVKRRKRFSKTA
jgi:transposase